LSALKRKPQKWLLPLKLLPLRPKLLLRNKP